MAILHLRLKVVQRSAGLSCVAAAAYRSGEKLYNEYDGRIYDYTRKQWIEYKEIMLPKGAPEEFKDRSVLWNSVETAEKASDARLAREIELALPKELSLDDNIELVHKFINENIINLGYPVDFAIHNPPLRNDFKQPVDKTGLPTTDINEMTFRNPHAHILFPVRPLDENGRWAFKSERLYICTKDGIEKNFTAKEFKEAKETGWEKQYRYADGDKKIWLTAKEGKERGLERVSNQPKTVRYGKPNPNIAIFDNAQEHIKKIRENWADIVNDRFAQIGLDIRISASQKTGRIPNVDIPYNAYNIDRRAQRHIAEGRDKDKSCKHTYQYETNQMIDEYNLLYSECENIDCKINDILKDMASELESIRSEYIVKSYEIELMEKDGSYSHNDIRALRKDIVNLTYRYNTIMNKIPMECRERLKDNINRIKLDTEVKTVEKISVKGIFNNNIYDKVCTLAQGFTNMAISYGSRVNERQQER